MLILPDTLKIGFRSPTFSLGRLVSPIKLIFFMRCTRTLIPLVALFMPLLAMAAPFAVQRIRPIVANDSLLTPEAAVALALANNYDIRIVRGDAAIAKLNNTKGNAGMLPNVNFVGNETFTLSTFQQHLANGNSFEALGAPFNVFSTGVQLNWTLFDGGRMYITKRRLEALESLGTLNIQTSIQQTAAAVLQAYYTIVRSRLQERAIREVIVLNEERLRIAEVRLASGMAAQTDALQAKIDVNQRRSDLILQQNTTAAAKRAPCRRTAGACWRTAYRYPAAPACRQAATARE